jgi:ABC-type branched-subunit amino acid transport system ATPase component
MNYQQTAKQKIRKVDSFYQLFPNIKKTQFRLGKKRPFSGWFRWHPGYF